jgi:hypothetical protein
LGIGGGSVFAIKTMVLLAIKRELSNALDIEWGVTNI